MAVYLRVSGITDIHGNMAEIQQRKLRTLIPASMVIVAALVSGCTATAAKPAAAPSSASASASTPPAYCASAAELKSSVKALTSGSILSGGVSGVQAGLTKVQTDFDTFRASAKSEFGTQADDMQKSLTALQADVQAARTKLDTSTIAAVAKGVGDLVTSAKALQTAVAAKCG